MIRRVLFSVIILLALLLAAEIGVTYLSEHGVEKALRSQYDLPQSLKVGINSFPFIVSLARNHLGELELYWEDELAYRVQEGMTEKIPYAARVNLYDVELNMPSLLTGKLDIRSISRIKAAVSVDLPSLNESLGLPEGALFSEDDRLFISMGGEKIRLKVKVSGDNEVTIEPYNGFTDGTGSQENPDAIIQDGYYKIVFEEIPMFARLQSASLDGNSVVITISIPMWEGYLGYLKCNLKDKPLI